MRRLDCKGLTGKVVMVIFAIVLFAMLLGLIVQIRANVLG
jgi:hypothetical protein